MTPTADAKRSGSLTPDEVKDRVAQKHGYKTWEKLVYHDSDYWPNLSNYINEAMQEYAEELYRQRLESVSGDLPSEIEHSRKVYELTIKHDSNSVTTGDIESAIESGINWMKEKASVVIAKERLKFNEQEEFFKGVMSEKDKTKDELQNILIEYFDKLEHKDKEIEELKESNKIKFLEMSKAMQKLSDQESKIEELNKLLIRCENELDSIYIRYGIPLKDNELLKDITKCTQKKNA